MAYPRPILKKQPSNPNITRRRSVHFEVPNHVLRLRHANSRCRYFVGSYDDLPENWKKRRISPMFSRHPPPFLQDEEKLEYEKMHDKLVDGLNKPSWAERSWDDKASNARKAMWDFWFYSRDEQWPRDPSYPTVPSFNHHDTLRQAFLDDKNADPPPSAVILDDSERGHLGLQTQTVDTHILGAKEDERNGFEDNENDGAQAMTDVRNDDGDTIGEEAVEIEDGDVEMNDADAEGGEDDTQKRQEVIDLTGSETDSEDGSSSGDDADDEDEESEEEEVGEDKPAAGQPSARSGGFTPINAADRPAEWVPQDL